MIEVILPRIGKVRAPVPPRDRALVIGPWHATARWRKDLYDATTQEDRARVLEACPDDPRAQAMSRRIGPPWEVFEGRTWRQRIAAAWAAEAYDTVGPPLGWKPNPGQCHGWIETWDGGLRGLVSIPLLRAVADLDLPVYLDGHRIRSAGRRPNGTTRGYSVAIGVPENLAKKPAGFAYFPEIGTITKKDPSSAGVLEGRVSDHSLATLINALEAEAVG